jgi:imidazolonepropionase-like amidohydrolase
LTRYWAPANAQVRTEARRRRYVEVRNALTKAIHDSGGKLLAGSDSPEWFLTYGITLHRELESFIEAGLTPYQALLTATRNPAEFLNATKNPLERIGNTSAIEGVAIGGRWLVRSELEKMIAAAVERLR